MLVEVTHRCSKCGEHKERGAFSRASHTKSGLQSWCKACINAKVKEHYRSSLEYRQRVKATVRRHYRENETYRESVRALSRRSGAVRRAIKEATVAPFTPDQLSLRWAYYGGKCWLCKTAPATVTDHVKPLSKGGAHMLCNLRPACAHCNGSKHNRWPYRHGVEFDTQD
jgi:5-methylcytosine-specific restriction endonuclease McrA